jgi:hypothetical protein
MRILKGLFSRASKVPPLLPQQHPDLGLLTWDPDSDGWTGVRTNADTKITLYIGGGSAQQYAPTELAALLVEPVQLMKERDLAARAALLAADVARPVPSDVILSGLETYQNYLANQAYDLVYESPSVPDVLWRVNFVGSHIESCGCDD